MQIISPKSGEAWAIGPMVRREPFFEDQRVTEKNLLWVLNSPFFLTLIVRNEGLRSIRKVMSKLKSSPDLEIEPAFKIIKKENNLWDSLPIDIKKQIIKVMIIRGTLQDMMNLELVTKEFNFLVKSLVTKDAILQIFDVEQPFSRFEEPKDAKYHVLLKCLKW